MKSKILLVHIVLILSILSPISFHGGESNIVIIGSLNGEINIASEKYVENIISYASKINAKLIILNLDTPGGMLDSVKNIMSMIESSQIPICVYVYPQGATAWSGGAFLLVSAHIAVMASGTSVGSAQPVELTPTGIIYVNQSKIVNAVVALIKHHARLHNRNETVAEMFITENLNLGAYESRKYNLIDFIADSVDELLRILEDKVLISYREGGEIRWRLVDKNSVIGNYSGKWVFKDISKSKIIEVEEGPQIKILKIITNPLISILMLVFGLYIFLIGLKTPGFGAEILGAIMIFISLIGLGFMGVEIAGIILILTGFILTLLELKTHIGILVLAGTFLIILGSLMLIPLSKFLLTSEEVSKIWMYTLFTGAFIASFFMIIVYKVASVQRRKPHVGVEKLIGSVGVAITDIDPRGEVRVMGEYWSAKTLGRKIRKGERVKIVGREGLTLIVEKQK